MSDLEDDTDWLDLGDDTITDGSFRPNNLVSDVFIFHKCSSKVLERVSLHNTNYFVPIIGAGMFVQRLALQDTLKAIPQKALIKFIRNAPTTLRWFRSNLTTENIKMLHHERPEIEFVS